MKSDHKPMSYELLLQLEQQNLESCFKNFRSVKSHLDEILELYSLVHYELAHKVFNDSDYTSQYMLFNNCYTSIPQGFTTLFRGHYKNSLFFLRHISESIQNSIFQMLTIKENTQLLWLSENSKDNQKYKEIYKHWFYKTGKNLIKEQFPFLISAYEHSSDMIHPNITPQEILTKISHESESTLFRINFQDIEKSNEGMLLLMEGINHHLQLSLTSLQWWADEKFNLNGRETIIHRCSIIEKKIKKEIELI